VVTARHGNSVGQMTASHYQQPQGHSFQQVVQEDVDSDYDSEEDYDSGGWVGVGKYAL